MNDTRSGIFVALSGQDLFVQIRGRGNYRNAAPLRKFGQDVLSSGCTAAHVDLAECQGMDSTFLGVLAGFGLQLRQAGQNNGLHLFNAGELNLHSCQVLGLGRMARLEAAAPSAPDFLAPPASEFRQLPDTDLTAPNAMPAKDQTTALMLEAHEDLCVTDERNEAKFKDVKQLLREELERQSAVQRKQA